MDHWQQRMERAAQLARLYPVSAELMYFYRDIARFQSTLAFHAAEPLRGFVRRHPDGALAAFYARVLLDPSACSLPPALAVRRASGRTVLCGYCHAWQEIAPDTCPACAAHNLRIQPSDEFPHIRIEACDACRTCVKAIDLTLDAAAVPEIDDLASVPLDLWAAAHHYGKLAPNLFGL